MKPQWIIVWLVNLAIWRFFFCDKKFAFIHSVKLFSFRRIFSNFQPWNRTKFKKSWVLHGCVTATGMFSPLVPLLATAFTKASPGWHPTTNREDREDVIIKNKKDTEKKERKKSYHRVCSSFSEDIVFLPISIQPLLLLNPLKSPEIRNKKTATKLSENHVIFRLYF